MFLIFVLLASIITVIKTIRIVAQRWVWRVIFPMLTTLFLLIAFLLIWYQVWWRCLWWWVWRWWFWVQFFFRFVPFFIFELFVDRVSGLLCKGVTESVCHVSGFYSVSCSKTSLVSSSELLIWLLYTVVLITLSKSWVFPSQSDLNLYLRVPFKDLALVEVAKLIFYLPFTSKAGKPRFLIFGISLRTEFARFTRMLMSKSATILSGRLFTPTFSMHEKSKFISWVADPSTELSNGSMFLVHLEKLELIPRIGLKTPTLTPGVPTLLGLQMFLSGGVQIFWMFLSTCALLHAAPIMIAFDVIFLSGDKLFRESSTLEFSRTFVTRSCHQTGPRHKCPR